VAAEDSDSQRQIERRTFLLHIRGCEIDGDGLIRKCESVVANRRDDAASGFSNRSIGKTGNVKRSVGSGGNVDFDIDDIRFDAIHGSAPSFEKHGFVVGENAKGRLSLERVGNPPQELELSRWLWLDHLPPVTGSIPTPSREIDFAGFASRILRVLIATYFME